MEPKSSPQQLLLDGCAMLDIALDERTTEMLLSYLDEIAAWNERFNLTSITEPNDMVIKHLLDSLVLLARFDLPRASATIDIGTGAGLPGIPLKIVRPGIELTLLESSAKKSTFLQHVTSHLGLESVWVANERAEDFGRNAQHRDKFSFAVSRAVAELTVLIEYALPLLRVGGRFFCYKAKGAQEEVLRAARAANLLGGRIDEVAEVVVPFLHAERYIVVVTKMAPSPDIYPRRAGVPAKKPIA